MSEGRALTYAQGMSLAGHLYNQLDPLTKRVEVAGSLRRRRAVINDLEMVCIPKWEERPSLSLLEEVPVRVNLMYEWAQRMRDKGKITWINRLRGEVSEAKLRPEAKQLKGVLPNGVQLDIYLTTPEQFGLIFLIRTGSVEFSQAVVTHAKNISRPSEGGSLIVEGQPVATPEEADVFNLLGLQYVEPEQRCDGQALKMLTGVANLGHHCHARGCNIPTAEKLLMCPAHWKLVPLEIQRQVWQHYRPGQETDKRPSREYMRIARQAIEAVAQREVL